MKLLLTHWSEILLSFANISNAKLMLVYFTAQMLWNWLLFKQEIKFHGNILNFSQKFCLMLPQNSQFDFDFWKSQNKNCGNLWQTIKCALTTGHKLDFYFGLIAPLSRSQLIENKGTLYCSLVKWDLQDHNQWWASRACPLYSWICWQTLVKATKNDKGKSAAWRIQFWRSFLWEGICFQKWCTKLQDLKLHFQTNSPTLVAYQYGKSVSWNDILNEPQKWIPFEWVSKFLHKVLY